MNCLVLVQKLELRSQIITSATILKIFIETFFLLVVLIEIYYSVIANYLHYLSSNYKCTRDCKTSKKKTCMVHFNQLRCSRRLKISAVLVLRNSFFIKKSRGCKVQAQPKTTRLGCNLSVIRIMGLDLLES